MKLQPDGFGTQWGRVILEGRIVINLEVTDRTIGFYVYDRQTGEMLTEVEVPRPKANLVPVAASADRATAPAHDGEHGADDAADDSDRYQQWHRQEDSDEQEDDGEDEHGH